MAATVVLQEQSPNLVSVRSFTTPNIFKVKICFNSAQTSTYVEFGGADNVEINAPLRIGGADESLQSVNVLQNPNLI